MTDDRRPLVSLVLLTYNQERFIEEAVESALAQDYSPLEIILSDDASTDSTFALIEKAVARYRGPHVVQANRNETNLGLSAHYSRVVAMTSGAVVVPAAGDDVSYPEKVACLVQPMLDDPTVVGVSGGMYDIDENGRRIAKRPRPAHSVFGDAASVIARSASVVAQCHAFRREVFDRFGPLSPYVNNEGIPLAFREALLGKFVYVDRALMDYRTGVGISNRKALDVDGVTIRDPIKYASWRYNGFRQIRKDWEVGAPGDLALREQIDAQLAHYEDLFLINRERWAWRSLWRSLRNGRISSQHLAGFTRRNSPRLLRRLYVTYREHLSES